MPSSEERQNHSKGINRNVKLGKGISVANENKGSVTYEFL